jgi:hypothetical protein
MIFSVDCIAELIELHSRCNEEEFKKYQEMTIAMESKEPFLYW